MAKLMLAILMSVVFSAGPTTAEPIEWKVTGAGNDLDYRLLCTRGNSLLLGGNVASGTEGLLGITEHLTTIPAGSERDFVREMASGDALLSDIMEQLRQQLRPGPQLNGRMGTSRR